MLKPCQPISRPICQIEREREFLRNFTDIRGNNDQRYSERVREKEKKKRNPRSLLYTQESKGNRRKFAKAKRPPY